MNEARPFGDSPLCILPDKETVELMTAFYTNLLLGKTVREAFYIAQKEMRSKYSPFFWAAFVLVE